LKAESESLDFTQKEPTYEEGRKMLFMPHQNIYLANDDPYKPKKMTINLDQDSFDNTFKKENPNNRSWLSIISSYGDLTYKKTSEISDSVMTSKYKHKIITGANSMFSKGIDIGVTAYLKTSDRLNDINVSCFCNLLEHRFSQELKEKDFIEY